MEGGGERGRPAGTWAGGGGSGGAKGGSGYDDNVPEWARDDVAAVEPGVNNGAFVSTVGTLTSSLWCTLVH